ncbi:MAG: glycerol-3-phosphate 1-O-acyltransferase PlsY [Oscillospiraceae bacterium]|nr:glycerol-3-phosphate 1-O-acyltransferase PlsY [Oscillospiraceae bacterium]
MLRYVLIVLVAYLLGSINSSVLVSKGLYRIDIRTRGSGNAGATNVARVFGMASGLLTFGGDILKTAAAMLTGRAIGGMTGFYVAGFACLVGHCYPAFFHLKGGKGVAVGAAMALLLDWRMFLCLLAAFLAVFLLTKMVSLCSIVAAALLPACCLLFGLPTLPCVLSAVAAVIVIWRHHGNIRRILRHEEKKFVPKSRKSTD